MRRLSVYIEIKGAQEHAGDIVGNSYTDAKFQYSERFLASKNAAPISISLPLAREPFSPEATKNFFEGLLPEGFSRRAVAGWIKTDENDYITIFSVLGAECLGAIKIVENGRPSAPLQYERLSLEDVKALAAEGAAKSTKILMETHLSLTGATGKVGLYYDSENDAWYLPKGDAPSTHIVKQSHIRLSRIVLNEHLCMRAAGHLGIEVPESFIVDTGNSRDSDILYAVKRYDRVFQTDKRAGTLPVPNRLHQEDFAQALGIAAANKYERENSGYLRRMFDLIRFNCADPLSEQLKLWHMICFNFLIGNTDCHLKNYSLLYGDNLRGLRLAPAYDLVSTTVYHMTDEMSFYIGGEINLPAISRKTFQNAAKEAGIPARTAMKIFDDLANALEKAFDTASEELTAKSFPDSASLKNEILKSGGFANL